MELTLLTVPACPNAAAFEQRLAAALAGYPGVVVHRREVADEREAATAGMHGSPTLLIDGVDPFAGPDELPSLSCRLYRDQAGGTGGAPSVHALRQALAAASHG
jgi:2-hydroxychromene-2-carboxylate isomerase